MDAIFSREQCLFFVVQITFTLHIPLGDFVFDVRIWSSNLLEHFLRPRRLAVVRQPFRTFLPTEHETDGLHQGNDTAYPQDDSPQLSFAEEKTQELRDEDPAIDQNLSEAAEEPFLAGRCHLANVDRHHDSRRASAQAGNESTDGHDGNVRGRGLKDRSNDGRNPGVYHRLPPALFRRDRTRCQRSDEATEGENRRYQAELERVHGDALR